MCSATQTLSKNVYPEKLALCGDKMFAQRIVSLDQHFE